MKQMGRAHVDAEKAIHMLKARGEIRMGDPVRAVQHFSGLCQSGVYQFALLCLPGGNDPQRLAAEVDDAVETFCRAWCLPAPE